MSAVQLNSRFVEFIDGDIRGIFYYIAILVLNIGHAKLPFGHMANYWFHSLSIPKSKISCNAS